MVPFQVYPRYSSVSPYHLQGFVTKQDLKSKDIPLGSYIPDGKGVAKSVWVAVLYIDSFT